MNEVAFTIPSLPPSINRLMRMHWAVRRRCHDDWSTQLLCAASKVDARALKAWAQLGEKMSVTMHVSSPQLFDEDNLNSLAKLPLDIMRNLQWLAGDDPAHMQFEKPTQEKGPKSVRFVIRRMS